MYIFKNALKNILRNKGRNILIAIIVTVIAGACAVTLSIRNSATSIVDAYEEKYNVETSISMDRSALMDILKGDDGDATQEEMIENYNNIDSLSVEDIEKYGDSIYVDSYYYVSEVSMDGKNLTKATDNLTKETTETKTQTETKTFPGSSGGDFPGGKGGFPGGSSGGSTVSKKTTTKITTQIIGTEGGDFTVKGYSSLDSMSEFVDGTYTISDGQVFSDFTGNYCIVSKELADLNELEVGGTIKLVNPDNSKLTYELTITGIYESNSSDSTSMSNMFSSSANTIITNATVVSNIISDDDDISTTITPTFIMVSKDCVENFTSEVKEKGLSEYYTVTDNVSTIEAATSSITNVKTFATTFLLLTLGIGAVVLLVLNSLTIRERKYEIGVLRTIGMGKLTVIAQFVFELMIVALVGLCVGAGIGASSSVPIANSLLASEIENSSTDYENIDKNFGGAFSEDNGDVHNKDFKLNGVANVTQIDSIDAVMDFKVLVELLGIGLLITIISSLSACISIARFQPLTILKERS